MDQRDLEANVQIGDFRIERRLGAGGMGIVYQARQVSLDRTVALKILGAALTREADRMRFQREAQAVAKLHHPAIAGVHFIGQDRHVCYIAMEFIDGLPLREVIDRLAAARDQALTIDLALRQDSPDGAEAREVRFDEPTSAHPRGGDPPAVGEPAGRSGLTPEAERLTASRPYLARCCALAIEAANALAHAHDKGVVHRDVKPENILVDREGHVHLIDFGVARFFEDNTLTNTGALVGTPMYMSPEQVTGRIDLDHRTDVYSLGLVLYELLTLARPITAPTREGVLRQIVTKAMPPASWRNPAIPRDLEGVLHKATARDPDDRYQTASEFAADLRRWLDGKSVAALPYRYRLDEREIKAERPAGIMVIAFGHFLVATFAAFVTIAVIGGLIALYVNEFFAKTVLDKVAAQSLPGITRVELIEGAAPFSLIPLAVSFYSAAIGFGLLAANRWARWVTIAVCSALPAWILYDLITDLSHGLWSAGTLIGAVIITLTVATVVYLLRGTTRAWFLLAERLRAEHGGASGVPLRSERGTARGSFLAILRGKSPRPDDPGAR
jgi:serine/threonine protein kinase